MRGARVSIFVVRGYQYSGYESINIRGTRVSIFGVRGYQYPGYEDINIRGMIRPF